MDSPCWDHIKPAGWYTPVLAKKWQFIGAVAAAASRSYIYVLQYWVNVICLPKVKTAVLPQVDFYFQDLKVNYYNDRLLHSAPRQ